MKYILATLLLISFNCYASDWRVEGGGDGINFLVDYSSIANKGKNKKVWVSFEYEELEGKGEHKHDSAKNLWVFNCSEKTVATAQDIAYLGNRVVKTYNLGRYELVYSDVVPDSYAEAAFEIACNKKK